MANFTTGTAKRFDRTVRRGVEWRVERNLLLDDEPFPVSGYAFKQEFREENDPDSDLLEVAAIEIPDDELNAVDAVLTRFETSAMTAGRHVRWHQFFIRGEKTGYEWVIIEEGWIRVV